jgi:hypothetical protein
MANLSILPTHGKSYDISRLYTIHCCIFTPKDAFLSIKKVVDVKVMYQPSDWPAEMA